MIDHEKGIARRAWSAKALSVLRAEERRSADTHLLRPDFPGLTGISVYFKDESAHPTGSLKHRLARSLFLYGICNGFIGPDTTLVEASSGSTAVSEAYFAALLHLPFVAVMPCSTSRQKIEAIERFGGRCHLTERADQIYAEARRIAAETNGHYLDQFTYAERATDWRGNNNIAESTFEQLRQEAHPVPDWFVMGAGTGGTSATIGRYIRYRNLATRLCVVDVEGSVFFRAWSSGDRTVKGDGSRIEGIGRPQVEPSFVPGVIDHMINVPDAASIAAAHILSERLCRKVGGSTGTNFFGVLNIASAMRRAGETGALVSLICDGGDRYEATYYNPAWLDEQGLDISAWRAAIEGLVDRGVPLPKALLSQAAVLAAD